jgi:hypothetical protein
VALKVGKNAIAAFRMKTIKLAFEKRFEIHAYAPVSRDRFAKHTAARQPMAPPLPSTAAKGAYF